MEDHGTDCACWACIEELAKDMCRDLALEPQRKPPQFGTAQLMRMMVEVEKIKGDPSCE